MVVLLSFEWSVDWTDRFILKGGIGIFYIFFEIGFWAKIKEFRFFGLGIHCGLQNFPFFSIWFSVFVKNTCLMGYGFGFRWSFLDCPIWIPSSLRSKRPLCASAPPLTSNSRETSVCSTCQHHSGSIRVLRTGMWTFIGFNCFACGFRFWSNFFLRFCGCGWFFSTAFPNRPSHTSVQWSSTRIFALQIENLSF